MKKQRLIIDGIPAILWGEDSDRIFIHVHGKLSRKEYAESFAVIAEREGYQTLSFDLPEHGERAEDHSCRCDVWNGIKDLNKIADYVYDKWKEVSLFACSLGAYFSLNAYADREFKITMFQSPIADMRWLVEHMMLWSQVTADRLKNEKEIETPIDTLRWDYYCYIIDHPITKWHVGTHILYGDLDNLQPRESINDFAKRFDARLTVSEGSEHPFMSERDFKVVEGWIENVLLISRSTDREVFLCKE